jgi:hypothetical protein
MGLLAHHAGEQPLLQLVLLGFDRQLLPIRSALRRVDVIIRCLEEGRTQAGRADDAGMPAVL